MRPLVVSGPPGSGKTSVARLLAQQGDMGAHVETDVFYDFVGKSLDPSIPEAAAQNEVVVQAYCRAAIEYQRGGYDVYIDGVIGPWLFPLILPILTSFDYVILDVDAALAHHRNRYRGKVVSAGIIERMYPQFDAAKRSWPDHVFRTDDLDTRQVARTITAARLEGRFTVTPNSI